jgi:hypothetical protein
MPVILSKSKYLSGLQCPKLLWRLIHDKENIPPYSEGTQAIFDQGHTVGFLAQSLFPGGVSIPREATSKEKLSLTQKALHTGKPIYDATFSAGGAYAQVDILAPDGTQWDLVEVKSSTSVNDINLHDLSLQRYACEAAGLNVGKCILAHINNQYVRQGDLDLHQLFILEDQTSEVASSVQSVPDRLSELQQVLASKAVPEMPIGPHCSAPYGCVLQGDCWAFLPEHSVFDLYRGGRKAWSLFEDNVLSMSEIGSRISLSGTQAVQLAAVQTGRAQVDKPAIRQFLKGLAYPLWLLDFETFQTAVPLYDGTKPYQQIPFQFSLHRLDGPRTKPQHQFWLAEGRDDPRPGFLAKLKGALGAGGDILAFNISFERARLSELARQYPEHTDWLEHTNSRFVDLITPFRGFAYYHPDQHGSCSLKAVLPALTGKGYDGMEIAEGRAAARAFLRVEHGEMDPEEKQRVRKHLETYCEQDTLGMVWILDALDQQSE